MELRLFLEGTCIFIAFKHLYLMYVYAYFCRRNMGKSDLYCFNCRLFLILTCSSERKQWAQHSGRGLV